MRTSKNTVAVFAIIATLVIAVTGLVTYYGAGFLFSYLSGDIVPANAQPDKVQATTVEDFYAQQVHWRSCSAEEITSDGADTPYNMRSYKCAQLYAPMDWQNPGGQQILLSVAMHRSGQSDAPLLFYNLGGPGSAAVASLSHQVENNLGLDLVRTYDIVALDPRGVGASTPVKCLTNEQIELYNTEGTILESGQFDGESTAEIVAKAEAENALMAKGCQRMSGDLFRHVDTVSAAKDFDMVRAVLGSEKLNYLGYSYGTFLGAIYADLFPQNVGRFVLDGAVDPAASIDDVYDMQMRGFEASINHWIDVCITKNASSCPLKGTRDEARAQLIEFLDSLADAPLQTSDEGRVVTQNMAISIIISMLYSENTYEMLAQVLSPAMDARARDGSMLLILSDYYNDRAEDGTYTSNTVEALVAVNNLDYAPSGTVEDWAANAQSLSQELQVFGDLAGYASAGLDAWPTPHAQRKAVVAAGAPPILVIGTTHDPATAYSMAQSLAAQLSSGVLVTNEGWDHTAYSRDAHACVTGAVESFFLDGVVPESGLVCGSK